MATILSKTFPDEDYKALKIICVSRGESVTEVVNREMSNWVRNNKDASTKSVRGNKNGGKKS